MKLKREILMSIVATLLIGASIFVYSTTPNSGITLFAVAENGVCSDLACVSESFVSCTPAKMTWSSDQNGQTITAVMEVVGVVDNLCYFKMTSDDRTLRECYFPLNSLSEGLAQQFFHGTNNGFGQLISDSCR